MLHSWSHAYSTIIKDLCDDNTYKIIIYADDTTLYLTCDQVFTLW